MTSRDTKAVISFKCVVACWGPASLHTQGQPAAAAGRAQRGRQLRKAVLRQGEGARSPAGDKRPRRDGGGGDSSAARLRGAEGTRGCRARLRGDASAADNRNDAGGRPAGHGEAGRGLTREPAAVETHTRARAHTHTHLFDALAVCAAALLGSVPGWRLRAWGTDSS